MVFGLFKRSRKSQATTDIAISAPLPVVDEEPRLVRLGPVLWQDVRYGMTRSDVLAVRTDAAPSLKLERLHDGSISELSIPHLLLAGHHYSVQFFFKDSGLVQVTIATKGGPSVSDFRNLVGALRLRYGREVEMEETLDSFSSAEWLSPEGINVNLACFPAADILNLNFQYRYADAARQL